MLATELNNVITAHIVHDAGVDLCRNVNGIDGVFGDELLMPP